MKIHASIRRAQPAEALLALRIFARRVVRFLAAAAAGAAMCASAATYVVNTTSDNTTGGDSLCTLREAIASANNAGNGDCGASSGAADVINFSVSGTITLGSQLPNVVSGQGALTIDGAASVTISGNNSVRVLQVDSGATLTLQNLTIANGRVSDYTGGNGAGVLNNGALTVTNSTFSGNSVSPPPYYSANGGGISSVGPLTVTNSTFSGNSATGTNAYAGAGGIYSGGPLTVTNSTFSGNSANTSGGGIGTDNATTGTITNSTFSGNSAAQGGGINNYIMTLTITNSTFSGNSANPTGGGGINSTSATTTINNSTFSGNSGDGISRSNGTVTLSNTIVASSTGNNCGATAAIVNGGNNIDDGTTCGWGSTNGSMSSASPNLGAITGSPAFFPLNVGSLAIDAGSNASCSTASQNGVARPADGDGNGTATCDIGSYEKPAIPQLAAPSVSATFIPSTQFLGNKGALRVVVSNPNASAISGVGYAASLPGGLAFSFRTVGTDCTGEFFAGPDGNTLYVSSLSMPASSTCTIDVFFTAAAVGTYTHNAGAITVSSSAGSATNPSPSGITMSMKPPGMQIFLPSTVALGTNASMTIALSRGLGDPNYFAVGASLGLPGGSTVSNPSGFTVGCSASGAAPAGGSTIVTSGGSISVTGSCALASLSVAFAAAGPYTFTIPAGGFTYQVDGSTTTFSNDTPVTASITVTPPPLTVSSNSLSFTGQLVGTSSASQTVTLSTGGANIVISAITLSGNVGDYSVSGCSPTPFTITATSGCVLTVTFTPTATGARAATVQISSNASGSPHSVSLSGTGTAPAVTLSPSPLLFGDVAIGGNVIGSATLTNSGTAPLNVTSIAVVGSAFALQAGGSCSAAAFTLEGSASCTVVVRYQPTAIGPHAGNLSVISNAFASPHSVALSGGTGVTITPSPVAFGSVEVNSSATTSLVVKNGGIASLAVSAVSTMGSGYTQTNTCTGTSVAPGGTCNVTVTFQPTAAGTHAGSLSVMSSRGDSPHTVSMSGIGMAPAVTLSPSPLSFGDVAVGGNVVTSAMLANTGSAALNVISVAVVGSAFTLDAGGSCGTAPFTLAASASCTLAVRYQPTAAGPHAGNLNVSSNAPGSPHSVPLSGGTGVTITPSPVAFGSVVINSSATASLVVRNGGTAPLVVSGVSTAGAGYSQTNTCTTPPVAPGGTCNVTVTFLPTVTGPHPGTMSVVSGRADSPHTVSMSGTATAPGVSLTPSPVAFGNVPVSSTASATLNLANTGTATLVISSIVTTGTFFSNTTTCGPTLVPGGSCPILVTYAPGAAGAHSGQVSVTTNAGAAPVVAPLSGTGAVPVLTLSGSSLDFGSHAVGTASAVQPVTITNSGGAPLNLSAITATGDFNFVGCSTPLSLAPGASCTLSIKFVPTAVGARSGGISIGSNASGSPHNVTLSGTGTAPGVSLTPSPVAFGNVAVGTSAIQALNLTNTGTAPLSVISITAAGTGFTQANGCPASLAPGATCQINVTFAPTSAGSHTGQVSVTTNAGAGPVVAPLSGTGAVPVLTLSGSSLDFGSQTVGTASAVQPVTITNTGGAPLNLSAIAASGDFNFVGCPTPLSLAPGASCTLSIKFVPTAVGARSGGISIGSNASGSPHAIALTGNGTPVPVPGIALAPGSAAFGSIVTGSTSTQVLVLSNPGTAPLAISSIATSGTGFSQTNACPASLAPSAACNINVTYAPTVPGSNTGQLQVVSNAAPSPLIAALSGSAFPATTAGLTLSASSVAFAPQFVGTTSASQTVTLTSSGTAPLVISQVAASGDFAFVGCGPSTLAPNATCSFTITFRPLTVGPQAGSIVVTSNASGSPHTVSLSGNGASLASPQIVLAPSAFAFGTLRTARTATLVGRLNNTGAATLVISQIQATGAFFTQSNNCPATVPVGGFCDITVTYSPTATGAHSGQLAIHSNAIPSPHVAAISGTGITVPPPFLSTNGPVSFGQQVTGTTVRRTLVLSNTGGDPLVISSMAIVGSGAFGVEGGCGTIAPEASCSLTVTFLATGISTFNGRLDIVSNHSGGVVQVQLTGQGVALPQPDLDFSVGALGFGNQTLNTVSGAGSTVRLTNIGGAPVTISALRATLPDYQISAAQCIGTLAPQASCDINVVFRPIAPGPRQASLVVDATPAQNDAVSLVGVGCRIISFGRGNPARLCSP